MTNPNEELVLTYEGEDYYLPEDDEEWDGLDWEVWLTGLE